MNNLKQRNTRTALAVIMSITLASLYLTACQSGGEASQTSTTTQDIKASQTQSTTENSSGGINASSLSVEYKETDLNAAWSVTAASRISFQGDSASLEGEGAMIDGSVVTITAAGTYIISGTSGNGQIIIDSSDQDPVRLVLNGVSLHCAASAPIYARLADKVVIILAEGSTNLISDGESYVLDDPAVAEPNAAIYSKCDLTITGSGTLTVDANYNNGITSKDKLKVTGGIITIDAVADGLKGRDYIAVKTGDLIIKAGADGLKSTNDETAADKTAADETAADETAARGFVFIEGGSLAINAAGAGVKAATDILISGGSLQIDSADDSINANNSLTISGGSLTLSSGDDGVHADANLTISGGTLSILKSYEGIESKVINIEDGIIHVISSDDGINVSGGNDGSSVNGRPGQNSFASAGDQYLAISGGYVAVQANGDGIDINGPITITDGTILINGPTANDNGAVDFTGSFKMTGGLLVAAGSSGMAQMPDETSTQYALMVGFQQALAAGTIVHIESSESEYILTFSPGKTFQNVVVCSPLITQGMTCVIYTGGTSTGTAQDSLISGGTYQGGTEFGSEMISGIVTMTGTQGGQFPGGRPGRR